MTSRIIFQFSPEPERYEFAEAPAYRFEPGRRDFFKPLGAGVALLHALESAVAGQESDGGKWSYCTQGLRKTLLKRAIHGKRRKQ